MKKVMCILMICFTTVAVNAAMDWDIYNDATIQDGDVYGTVNIYDTPPDQTTVNMTGGDISTCNVFDTALFNCYGGEIGFLYTYSNSTITINNISRMSKMDLFDYSTIYLYNGAENISNVRIYDNATLHIYGSSLSFNTFWIEGFSPNGQSFQINIRNRFVLGEHIVLHEIPEPLTSFLLGLGGIFLRKKLF